MPGLVTLLTDFGTDDVFVGLCHAAVLHRAPAARIVDLGHAVPPQDVPTGAARLMDAVAWVRPPPDGVLVHCAVVDPGVGTARAAVALAAGPPDAGGDGDRSTVWLVGPDNGLLRPAAERLGGIRGAWRLAVDPGLPATFHGRDVFAPAAGALAAGADPDELGEPIDPTGLVALLEQEPHVTDGQLMTAVRDLDRYGNVQLAADGPALHRAGLAGGAPCTLTAGTATGVPVAPVPTFGALEPGALGLLTDSFGWLAVVAGNADAAARLQVARGDVVRLDRAPSTAAPPG